MEVITLDQVTLLRRTQEEFSYDLKSTIFSMLQGSYRKPSRRLVLDNVTLSVKPAEKIGVIGMNGAGKSTLLKVISGILKPTRGSAKVRGSISPLIELQAGFEPEISVAKNIVLYGVLLGFSQAEILARVPHILEFAELQDYAMAPVKSLSSGMAARLGFAIATEAEPDILILDEVLSVGDERFQQKCYQRIEKFWQGRVTMLFVSHSLDQVRQFCDRVVWLHQGRVELIGSPEEVTRAYLGAVKRGLERTF